MGCFLLLGLSLVAGCGGGGSAIQSFTTPPPRVTPSSCPSGQACLSLVSTPQPQTGNVGQFFSLDPAQWVQGGVRPWTVSIKSGTLPSGLTLSSQGVVQGIPSATAVATAITFAVTDSESPPVSVLVPISLSISTMIPFAALSPSPGPLPGGTVGAPYVRRCFFGHCFDVGAQIIATGGVMPYAWSWVPAPGSSLPPGLGLVGSCGGLCATESIKGTPITAGTYNFVVAVTDSESPPKVVSANYTITVAPAPSPSSSP